MLPALTDTLLIAGSFRKATMVVRREPSRVLGGYEVEGSSCIEFCRHRRNWQAKGYSRMLMSRRFSHLVAVAIGEQCCFGLGMLVPILSRAAKHGLKDISHLLSTANAFTHGKAAVGDTCM